MGNILRVINKSCAGIRIKPLMDTICRFNTHLIHHADDDHNFKLNDDVAIWTFEYPIYNMTDSAAYINSREEELLNFKGKIIFFSLGDNNESPYEGLSDRILDRIDAWVVHSLHFYDDNNRKKYICNRIIHKYVIIPKYSIMNFNLQEVDSKINGICFRGGQHTKIDRITPLMIIKNDVITSKYLYGGLYPIGDKPIPNSIFGEQLNKLDYMKEIQTYQHTLCLAGNSRWCYRHLEAMSCGNSIISSNLMLDGHWLYNDMITRECYIYKEDYSDLLDACIYALNNVEESVRRGQKLKRIYHSYFELNSDNTYKDYTWLNIQNQLNNLGINV